MSNQHHQVNGLPPLGRHGQPRRRILLADDDADMRVLLATFLGHDGYDVTECADGNDLFEVLSTLDTPPDLVVSDVQMPRASGLSVLARLKRHHPHVPVILITAFGSSELHREARRLGAATVLDKPFRMSALRDIVRELLGAEDAASPSNDAVRELRELEDA